MERRTKLNIKESSKKIWNTISKICVTIVLMIVVLNIIAYYSGEDSALGSRGKDRSNEQFNEATQVKIKDQSFKILINREGTEIVFSDLKGNSKIYLVATDLEHGIIMLQEK